VGAAIITSAAAGAVAGTGKLKGKTLAGQTPGNLSDPTIPFQKFKAVLFYLIQEIHRKASVTGKSKFSAVNINEDGFAELYVQTFKLFRQHLYAVSQEYAQKHKINYEALYTEAKVIAVFTRYLGFVSAERCCLCVRWSRSVMPGSRWSWLRRHPVSTCFLQPLQLTILQRRHSHVSLH
jgi:hypothetical protein